MLVTKDLKENTYNLVTKKLVIKRYSILSALLFIIIYAVMNMTYNDEIDEFYARRLAFYSAENVTYTPKYNLSTVTWTYVNDVVIIALVVV